MQFLRDIWNGFVAMINPLLAKRDRFLMRHHKNIIIGLVVVLILVLVFGCAGSQKAKPDWASTEGPGYCLWEGAPSWLAKDFITDPDKWGVIDGYQFQGKHGLPCYALKIDAPPADGTCDAVGVICESGSTDDRYGPGTPLVQGLGTVPCEEYDSLLEAIQKDQPVEDARYGMKRWPEPFNRWKRVPLEY